MKPLLKYLKQVSVLKSSSNMFLGFLKKLVTKVKLKYIIFIAIVLMVLYVAGFLSRLFEKDFDTQFHYPYEGDIEKLVLELRSKQTPSIKPINQYDYRYITDCKYKCEGDINLRLVFLIKSDPENFERRLAIRKTWGYEKRFADVEIRTVFLLGVRNTSNLQNKINTEHKHFKDIVQANFTDAYFNNTIKTITGFKWAVTYCPNSKYYMFADDDMYVAPRNVLRYVRNPTKYPEYILHTDISLDNVLLRKLEARLVDIDLPDGIRFYSGYVVRVSPLRDLFSKWYITLSEYPYNYYPLYATAGAYIVTIDALMDMYYTSFYTKHFRFDDVYLGIVALKAKIEPYHNENFHTYKKKYTTAGYTHVIASHGYDDPQELMEVWNEQKELGNA